jgi:long-chain acyl-CoA synthetase
MFITTVIDEMGARYPHKEAVVCGGKCLTFHQLNKQTHNFSKKLFAQGIGTGDTVGILLPNCAEYAASFIAPLRIGAISVPLDPRSSPLELEAIFRDCNLSALITTPERLEVVGPLVRSLRSFKTLIVNYRFSPGQIYRQGLEIGNTQSLEDMLKTETDEIETSPIFDEDDAVYMYTSGTTGPPKGVILTHGVIARRGANTRNLSVTSDDKCYTIGGLSHNAKLFIGLIWSLYLGIPFYTDTEFHPEQTLNRLTSFKISFFHASPFHFGVLANWEGFNEIPKLPFLKLCLASGNAVSMNIAQKFQERFGIGITENYGITEAGGLYTDGVPHPNVQMKILGEKGHELENNQVGEVIVTGPGKAKGYLNRPQLTAKVFKGDWFYTGDLGKIDEMGRLHIVCRKKNLIVIDGEKIYPGEIQEVLRSHTHVQDALIRKNEEKGLKAFVVLNTPCSAQALLEFCRERLATLKVPHVIEVCEELPYLWKDAIERSEFNLLS